MNKFIKCCFLFVISIFSFFALELEAKVSLAYLSIDRVISIEDCITASKEARGGLFEDDFGEFTDGNAYTYSNDKVIINVMCFDKRNLVFISVSTQDLEPLDYLNTFARYLKPIK